MPPAAALRQTRRQGGEIEPPDAGRESIGRTILVVEDHPYLWAALRQRVDPALAYVRSATPGEVATVWRTCRPWPWMLVGTVPVLPPRLVELIGSHPIPVHWVGPAPGGLPGRPAAHAGWMELVEALERLRSLADNGVAGVRLLRNRGLQAPDGRIVQEVFNLEGLLAAPTGLALTPSVEVAAALQREIDASGLPLRLERDAGTLRLSAGGILGA